MLLPPCSKLTPRHEAKWRCFQPPSLHRGLLEHTCSYLRTSCTIFGFVCSSCVSLAKSSTHISANSTDEVTTDTVGHAHETAPPLLDSLQLDENCQLLLKGIIEEWFDLTSLQVYTSDISFKDMLKTLAPGLVTTGLASSHFSLFPFPSFQAKAK